MKTTDAEWTHRFRTATTWVNTVPVADCDRLCDEYLTYATKYRIMADNEGTPIIDLFAASDPFSNKRLAWLMYECLQRGTIGTQADREHLENPKAPKPAQGMLGEEE